MNYYRFNSLPSQDKVSYIYHHCKLVDFEIVKEQQREFGVCLYHDGSIFVELCFDGLQGEQVKEIKAYGDINQLAHWYERVDIGGITSAKI
ncbi:MAG: hypothetical protein ACLFUB_08050 [Cyclobacteriaceae bacterium]